MNWSEWEMIWKRQPPPQGADADLAVLRQTFAAKSRRQANALFVRNVSEAAAGLLVSAVFAWVGFHLKKLAWPVGIAVLLVLGVTGFFIKDLMRSRRLRLGPEAALREKIAADLEELRHQRRLLLGLRTWYLAPLAVAMVIFGVTVALNDPMAGALLKERFVRFALGFYVMLCVALFWMVWVMNRRAVRTQLEPRLAELEKLSRELPGHG